MSVWAKNIPGNSTQQWKHCIFRALAQNWIHSERQLLNWTLMELVLIALSVMRLLRGKIKLWCNSSVRKSPKKTLCLTLADSSEARANQEPYRLSPKFIFFSGDFSVTERQHWPASRFLLAVAYRNVGRLGGYLSGSSPSPLLRITSVASRNDLSSTESSGLQAVTPFSSRKKPVCLKITWLCWIN